MSTEVETKTCNEQGLEGESDGEGLADWMGKLPPHLLDVPIHKLSIPGSHNSGTYELHKDWGIAPDADPALKKLASVPIVGAMAQDIVQRWSQCQSLSVGQQLGLGVRFLDMRVCYNAAKEELHVTHSLYGPKISTCIEDVKTFLEEHDKEAVLIDFNHFYQMELENHLQLITYVLSELGSLMCPYSSLGSLTLNAMRERGTRVVVFYHDSTALDFPEFWPPPAILSPWANTMDVEKCLEFQGARASRRREASPAEERFHACQVVLTPGSGDLLQKFSSSLRAECAHRINPRLPQWLQSPALKDCRGMVFLADFVQDQGFVRSVVELNT